MKYLTLLSLIFILFSCDPEEKAVTPDPSITPPEWIRGSWTYTDSSNYTENLIISEDDIVHERLLSTGKKSTSYMDSCKEYSISVNQEIKYNSYFHIKFTDKNDSINLLYLAKIAGDEIRAIDEISPTPKSYTRVN
ncbi:MAG: hypothetical protein ISP71_01390 [Flavobacteriales bacterium]|nr:hypothetical protein [Flavobacteriales bacterium]